MGKGQGYKYILIYLVIDSLLLQRLNVDEFYVG